MTKWLIFRNPVTNMPLYNNMSWSHGVKSVYIKNNFLVKKGKARKARKYKFLND